MGLAWCFQDKAQTLQQLLQCSLRFDTIVCRYPLSLFWDPEIQPLPESMNFIPPAFDHALPFALPSPIWGILQVQMSQPLGTIPLPLPSHIKKKINHFILWMIIYVIIPESKHKAWHRKEHLSDQHFCSPQLPSISPFIKASCLWLQSPQKAGGGPAAWALSSLVPHSSKHPIICKRRGRLLIHWQELPEAHSGMSNLMLWVNPS